MTKEIEERITEQEADITGYTLEEANVVYPAVDETLRIRGKAADAKRTGDILRGLCSYDDDGFIVIHTPD